MTATTTWMGAIEVAEDAGPVTLQGSIDGEGGDHALAHFLRWQRGTHNRSIVHVNVNTTAG